SRLRTPRRVRVLLKNGKGSPDAFRPWPAASHSAPSSGPPKSVLQSGYVSFSKGRAGAVKNGDRGRAEGETLSLRRHRQSECMRCPLFAGRGGGHPSLVIANFGSQCATARFPWPSGPSERHTLFRRLK